MPSYSPDFHPIERFWLRLKVDYFSDFIARSTGELNSRLCIALNALMDDHPIRTHFATLEQTKKLGKAIEQNLVRCETDDPLIAEEIRVGILDMQVMEAFHLYCCRRAGKTKRSVLPINVTARHLLELDQRLQAVWRSRNKASAYYQISEVLRAAARFLASA